MMECWNHEHHGIIRLLMFDTIIALRTTVQITRCWVIWPVFPFTVSRVALFFFLKAPVFIGQSEDIYWT